MIIEEYGIKLVRLTHDKIEMVRCWRNDIKISQYMVFKDEITPEMQERWFANLDNEKDYYFIVEYKGFDIGLANIKDFDSKSGEGEAGLFIYDDSFLNSGLSFIVCLCLNNFFFDKLGGKLLNAYILDANRRAIRFNQMLGYEHYDGQYYKLSPENYEQAKNKIKRMLHL